MNRTLDSENKFAHLVFHLKDGSVLSSKEVHFHDVKLNDIQKVEGKFKYYTHTLDKSNLPESFKEFVHFRSGGVTYTDNGTDFLDKRPILTWSLGWTDGETEFMQEYQFKSGELIREYTMPRNVKLASHFHPESGGIS